MVSIEDYKIKPNKKIIDDLKIQIIYIPLESRLGYKYSPTVRVGDYVCIGTIVGKNQTSDMPLLSTTSGTVVGFEKKYISNGHLVECVVIENDFKEKYLNKVGKKKDITKYSKEEFIYMLTHLGITGMGGSDFPTYIKYDTKDKIKYLIINGTECEIYASADSALMYNHPEEILEGIDAIMEIMDIDYAYIAIKETNTMVIKKFLKYINTYPNIKVYGVLDAYPCGYERILVNSVLGYTYDRLPKEVSTIVNNVSTIYAIYEMLKYHKPLIERTITISGPGIKHPANYKVKVGTNFNEIILKTEPLNKLKNPILIAGGAMMGTSIPTDELIVTKDLNCILVLEDLIDKPSPCIKCGKCAEVCPRNLIPSMIINNPANSKALEINKCIACGLCSYVCPSKIEVRDLIKKIKEDNHD